MTFSSFLFGLLVLYVIYYGIVIFLDMNKNNQSKSGEEYSDIRIDLDEFKAVEANSVYSVDGSPVVESQKESPIDSSVVSAPESETTEEFLENNTELNEEELAKNNNAMINHGGIDVYDAKKMIREMGENPFSGTANEYMRFV